MAIAFNCKSCGKRYSVKDDFAGKKVKCAACGETMVLPAAGTKQPLPPVESTQQKVLKPVSDKSAEKKPAAGEDYELDAAPAPVKKSSKPVMAGHILQPKIDPNQIDEFELEPPIESKVEVGFFFDDDAPAPAKPAVGNKSNPAKKSSSPTVPAAGLGAAELTLEEEPKAAPPPPEPTVPCPKCGEQIKQSSVLCIHCGLNLRTGEQIEGATKKGGLGKLFGGLRREK